MAKAYADLCLESAEQEGFDCSLSERVPELAKRLKKAIHFLRTAEIYDSAALEADQLAEELEAIPEGE